MRNTNRLRFRVWDTLSKRYIHSDGPGKQHHFLTLEGDFVNFQNGSGGGEYVVEQFTGSQDKTGHDIYEGDICLFSDWARPKSIEWVNGRYWFGNTQVICCDFECEEMKIIGNIHENPELLNNEA